MRRYPWIKYSRNEENIGSERNIYYVTSLAINEYIWIFGDDDTMLPEAIPAVFRAIEDKGANLVVCNYSLFTKDLKRQIKSRSYGLKSDMFISDRNQLLRNFGLYLGLISSVVIRKDVYRSIPAREYEQYSQYRISFVYIVYSAIAEDCRAAYISKAVIINRTSNSIIPDWRKCFVIGPDVILKALRPRGYSASAIRAAKSEVLRAWVIKHILNERINRRPIRPIYRALFQHYKCCWAYWLICLPLRLVPISVLTMLKRVYRHFYEN